MMKRFATVLVLVAVAAGVSMIDQPRVRAEGKECSTPGTCPLHDWMEKEMQAALDANDLKTLSEHLDKAATMAPDPTWNEGEQSWSKTAKAGAAAAKAGDAKAAGQSCKTCHKAWRKQYKEKHRARALNK